MNAEDILNNTDPQELRNLLRRMKLNSDAFQRPVPNIIINEAPQQFPPSSTTVINKLPWINVKDYGALGDGSADDTASINTGIAALNTAIRGVLYFPAGAYKCTAALTTITADCLIMGDGTGSYDNSTFGSEIICTSGTATLFTITALHGKVYNLSLVNTASTPSAGAGIKTTSSTYRQKVDFFHVRVFGFYINILVDVATDWVMDGCYLEAPVKYGLQVKNALSTDRGTWLVTNSHFRAGTYNSDAAIRIENSAGSEAKIANFVIQRGTTTHSFNHGIDFAASAYAHFTVANGFIANIRGNGINASGSFLDFLVTGVQFGLSYSTGNNTGNAIYITTMTNVVIANCIFAGGSTPAAIALSFVTTAKIVGNINVSFSSLVTQSSCSGVIVIEPGTTVTAETSYGQASSVGSSSFYAKEDHTHGTPALSAATPQNVGSSGAAGSGTTPSKNDHAHQGVHSLGKSGDTALYADVTLSEGSGVVITRSSNDLQIAAAGSAGQVTETARWESSGGTTFDLPDVAEYLLSAFDNGSLVDPLIYSLSSDRTQIVFDSSITSTHIVVAEYVLAQV